MLEVAFCTIYFILELFRIKLGRFDSMQAGLGGNLCLSYIRLVGWPLRKCIFELEKVTLGRFESIQAENRGNVKAINMYDMLEGASST